MSSQVEPPSPLLRKYGGFIRAHLTVPDWLAVWAEKVQNAQRVSFHIRKDRMAKAYRTAPLIGADDETGLPIRKLRLQKTTELLGRMVARFDDDFILHVATEIGLDECITYDATGKRLVFDCTSLQLVALSTTLAACAEYRDARKSNAR